MYGQVFLLKIVFTYYSLVVCVQLRMRFPRLETRVSEIEKWFHGLCKKQVLNNRYLVLLAHSVVHRPSAS